MQRRVKRGTSRASGALAERGTREVPRAPRPQRVVHITIISTANRHGPRHFVIITLAALNKLLAGRRRGRLSGTSPRRWPGFTRRVASRVKHGNTGECTGDCHLGMSRSYDCCYRRHFVTSLANVTLATRRCRTWVSTPILLTERSLITYATLVMSPAADVVLSQSNTVCNNGCELINYFFSTHWLTKLNVALQNQL